MEHRRGQNHHDGASSWSGPGGSAGQGQRDGAADRPGRALPGTNAEIGRAIFLSTRTVEFHLSRAYRKLGISSRTELASRLAGAGQQMAVEKEN